MAIKRITDLPIINLRKQEISAVDESWMEISFNESEGKYVSRGFKYGNLKDDIFYHILSGGDDHKTEFYCSVDFMYPVNMYNNLAISGDFLLNEDMPDYELRNYRVNMRSGIVNIFSDTDIQLCSNEMIRLDSTGDTRINAGDEFDLSAATISFRSNDNTFYDKNGNQLVKIRDDLFRVFTKSQFDENSNFKKNVTINGYLTVDNDIKCHDVYGHMFYGIALCAMWADISEKYRSDDEYTPGTLVKFGGEYEITIADTNANAVVTDKPGFILNSNGEGVGIALTGRTPVKVYGKVNKFDKIYLSKEIKGVGSTENNGNVIGIALQNKSTDDIGLVECVVKMEF